MKEGSPHTWEKPVNHNRYFTDVSNKVKGKLSHNRPVQAQRVLGS